MVTGDKIENVSANVYSHKALSIVSRINFVSVDYELSTDKEPSDNAKQIAFPAQMKGFSSGLEKATDNTYLHVVADIKMPGDKIPQ